VFHLLFAIRALKRRKKGVKKGKSEGEMEALLLTLSSSPTEEGGGGRREPGGERELNMRFHLQLPVGKKKGKEDPRGGGERKNRVSYLFPSPFYYGSAKYKERLKGRV